MKKILAVGVMAVLAAGLTFGQAPDGKKPAQKAPPSKVKLNPQPEPPGNQKLATQGDKVSLNPQPLPPGAHKSSTESKVALNPQPLPPGAKSGPGKNPSIQTKSTIHAKSKKSSGGTSTGSTSPK